MRTTFSLVVGLLPATKVKNWLLNLAGHRIDRSASIAPIILLRSNVLDVGPDARIGALSCFRGLTRLTLGKRAEIGQLNWISAADFLVRQSDSPSAGTLTLGPNASLTNRHYLDASGGILIGDYATVAGVRSVFMTHGIDVEENCLETAPIEIGEYAMVGGSCRFVMGSQVPPRSVVAMGSTVIRGLEAVERLYAGTPARSKKELPSNAAYFMRVDGKVHPRPAGNRGSDSIPVSSAIGEV